MQVQTNFIKLFLIPNSHSFRVYTLKFIYIYFHYKTQFEQKYCGNGIPPNYQSKEAGENIYLRFYTDETNEGVGFVLGYKEIGMYYWSLWS